MAWSVVMLLGVCLACCFLGTQAGPRPKEPEAREPTEACESYNYCDGVNFPVTMTVRGKRVQCDAVPVPRDRCCLPQAKHKVCYNIMVDGKFLNYDITDEDDKSFLSTTHFMELCEAITGNSEMQYAGISTESGGGYIIYRYGEWVEVQAGNKHIKDLACQIP